jgi:ubiquitin-activating enzyme E1
LKPKSETAANTWRVTNPKLTVIAKQDRIRAETENTYNKFFEGLDSVCNYMDRRCVYYELPLLESGTLGTKRNTRGRKTSMS